MSMQDPMSQMSQAQKLSIPQLQQALRDGTIDPQVGQIVLASKIKQSKDAKMALAAQTPKQPPVVQQDMAYGQGVPALPTNLPAAGMAAGGIIAFDEGGHVPRFGLQDSREQLVEDPLGRDLNNSWVVNGATDLAFPGPRMMGRGMDYLGDAITNLRNKNKMVIDPVTKQPISLAALRNKPINLASPAANAQPADATNNNPQVGDYVNSLFGFNNMGAQAVQQQAQQQDQQQNQQQTQDRNSELDAYFGRGDTGSASSKTKGTGAGSQGIGAYKIKPYDDSELKTILSSENNPDTGKPWTYSEIADRNKAEATAAGVDPDIYKSQREDLDKLKEKSAERSKLDSAMPWFALAEGLGQAPKAGEAAPSFITAATRGLAGYGKSATEIDEKEQARQEKLTDKGNALALAQNQFNQAQYTGNKADLKDADNAVKAARMNLANLGVKGVDQQNELSKTVFEAQTKMQIAQMQEQGANARYGKDEQTIKGIAKAIMADHPEMSVSDALKQAYLTKGAASVYGADVGADKNKLTQYNKYTSDFNKSMLNNGKKPLSYEQWLAGIGGPTTASADYAGFVDHTKY